MQDRGIVLDPGSNKTIPWTVEDYLHTFSSFSRSGNPIKLGVGYTCIRKVGLPYTVIIRLPLKFGYTLQKKASHVLDSTEIGIIINRHW